MLGLLYRVADLARHSARRRSWSPDQATGRRGEDLAHRFLRRVGFTIVARNYRPPSGAGEIDLIAWDGGTLVFVEVKSRQSEEFGKPDRAVDQEKQLFLERVGRDYARRAGASWERVRFDAVSVLWSDPPHLELLKDIFRPDRTI